MLVNAICPHCDKKVRIDKGDLNRKGSLIDPIWDANCPECGKVISLNIKRGIIIDQNDTKS